MSLHPLFNLSTSPRAEHADAARAVGCAAEAGHVQHRWCSPLFEDGSSEDTKPKRWPKRTPTRVPSLGVELQRFGEPG